MKTFFHSLQAGLYLTSFSDRYFQSLVIVPQVELQTCPQTKTLLANVWLVDKLFYYNYPFYFPNLFQTNFKKEEFKVRFTLFQKFNSKEIEKVILVREFINSYSSALNNSQKPKIKESFIEVVKILQEKDLIEPNYKIISKGLVYSADTLTTKNISEGFVIYEKLLLES